MGSPRQQKSGKNETLLFYIYYGWLQNCDFNCLIIICILSVHELLEFMVLIYMLIDVLFFPVKILSHCKTHKWCRLECKIIVRRVTTCNHMHCLYTHTCFILIVTYFVTIVVLSILNLTDISELVLQLGVPLRRRFTEIILCQRHEMKLNFKHLWEKEAKLYIN